MSQMLPKGALSMKAGGECFAPRHLLVVTCAAETGPMSLDSVLPWQPVAVQR